MVWLDFEFHFFNHESNVQYPYHILTSVHFHLETFYIVLFTFNSSMQTLMFLCLHLWDILTIISYTYTPTSFFFIIN